MALVAGGGEPRIRTAGKNYGPEDTQDDPFPLSVEGGEARAFRRSAILAARLARRSSSVSRSTSSSTSLNIHAISVADGGNEEEVEESPHSSMAEAHSSGPSEEESPEVAEPVLSGGEVGVEVGTSGLSGGKFRPALGPLSTSSGVPCPRR